MSSSHSTITGLFEDTPGQIPSFENWKECCEKDKFCQEIRVALNDQTASRNDIELASCVITEHSFKFNEREYIPETLRETILNQCHENRLYGHRGATALYILFNRCY